MSLFKHLVLFLLWTSSEQNSHGVSLIFCPPQVQTDHESGLDDLGSVVMQRNLSDGVRSELFVFSGSSGSESEHKAEPGSVSADPLCPQWDFYSEKQTLILVTPLKNVSWGRGGCTDWSRVRVIGGRSGVRWSGVRWGWSQSSRLRSASRASTSAMGALQ